MGGEQLTILFLDNIVIRITVSEWPKSVLIQSPVAISHILIDLSREQLTIWLSLNALTQKIQSEWPENVLKHSLVLRSSNLIVRNEALRIFYF